VHDSVLTCTPTSYDPSLGEDWYWDGPNGGDGTTYEPSNDIDNDATMKKRVEEGLDEALKELKDSNCTQLLDSYHYYPQGSASGAPLRQILYARVTGPSSPNIGNVTAQRIAHMNRRI